MDRTRRRRGSSRGAAIALVVAGVVLFAIAALLVLTSIRVSGSDCGSAFRRERPVIDDPDRGAEFEEVRLDCVSAVRGRKRLGAAAGTLGVLSSGAGVYMYISGSRLGRW